MTSRLVAAFVVALLASCSNDDSYNENSQTVCWLASEWPSTPKSTGVDSLDEEAWLAYWRSGFLHCAENRAYQVIQLGDGGELAKAATLKYCSQYWLSTYKQASASYHHFLEPSATDEALQKFANADVEKLLNDLSTQIEVFKLCYAKGIKSPSWN